MKDSIYKMTEYYLYNFKNIDNIIDDISERIISSINISSRAWLKNKKTYSNTLENQAIKLADNKKINNLKRAKIIINHLYEDF